MSRPQTSVRNPPSTGYERPAARKFYVWRDRRIRYEGGWGKGKWGDAPWRWLCTMCEPPSYGFRAMRGGWESIMTATLPRHMQVRGQHHAWVARTRPVYVPHHPDQPPTVLR